MKTVLITGATSGIGRQLALDYATDGWQVVACGRNISALAELEQLSTHISTLQFDVTRLASVSEAINQLHVQPSLWILNAGTCEYIEHGEIDSSLIARVMAVNFAGVVHCLEAIQHHLQAEQRVAIISSIAGETALPRAEAYGASKAAISYLARSLRMDWAPRGIKLSLIYPGFVATPLTAKNDFPMPMMITAEQASKRIRRALASGRAHIYVPARFTAMIRVLALLPYSWQQKLLGRTVRTAGRHS